MIIRNLFKISSVILLLFVCISVAFCQEAAKQNIDIILSNLEKQDSFIKDLQADYVQTLTYLSTNEQFQSEGIFKHKKPNYICLSQISPTKQYTYIDGKHITTYVPDNKQAIVEKWKDVINSDMLLTSVFKFIKNWKTFKKEYIVELKEETKVDYSFLIKPINPKENWTMTITVSRSSSLIISTSFNNGNFIVDVKLTNYKLNNNYSNDIFKFVAPKNVDVIEL
jgi:outer membrane lipoprotein-sorting protein